ncbi:hypothetical protein RQN30_10195 [Arcanobacterium hippocoleae]
MKNIYLFAPRCVYLPVDLVANQELTYLDLGVLAVLLSGEVKDGGYRVLARRNGIGQESCRAALRRLERAGLVYRFLMVKDGKKHSMMVSSPFPVSADQACEKLLQASEGDVVSCLSHPSFSKSKEISGEACDKTGIEPSSA